MIKAQAMPLIPVRNLLLALLAPILVVGVGITSASAQSRAPHTVSPSSVDANFVGRHLLAVIKETRRLERLSTSCRRQSRIKRKLRDLRRHVKMVLGHVRAGRSAAVPAPGYAPAPGYPPTPAPAPGPGEVTNPFPSSPGGPAHAVAPMHRRAFRGLLRRVKNARFQKDRLAVIATAARHNYFSSRQVKRVIQKMRFSKSRLRALRILAPRILDGQNAHMVLDAFRFSESKRKARRILRRSIPRSL